MAHQILLPRADGTRAPYTLGEPSTYPSSSAPSHSRVAYAAAHVVCDPLAENGPASPAHLDWDATMAYRHHLWSLGFSVAEAMDTAQRGMGLDWKVTGELIRRSVADARAIGAGIACGAGTDQLASSARVTLDDVQAAYEEQCSFIEGEGGRIILMASRALASCARTPDDYIQVYDRILTQVSQPVILHWLGDMFDPALAGYWGYQDLDAAMMTCLSIIERHAAKIDGIKISLLNADRETAMRRRLPPAVRMYTGDDFNYPELIRGDEQGYSHALLGIFDAIAPAAAAALLVTHQAPAHVGHTHKPQHHVAAIGPAGSQVARAHQTTVVEAVNPRRGTVTGACSKRGLSMTTISRIGGAPGKPPNLMHEFTQRYK